MSDNNDSVFVYKLEAVDTILNSDNTAMENMLIGFFDSLDSCYAVENDYLHLPGFSLPSCKFKITPYVFPKIEGYNIEHLYYVQASKMDYQIDVEQVTEIGLFLTIEEAESAKTKYMITLAKDTSKRQDNDISDVYIDKYKLNERHWQYGFSRYTY